MVGILIAQPFHANDTFALRTFVLPAACVAVFQSIVLCVLLGRVSLPALMWIPASAGTVLVGTLTVVFYLGVIRAYPNIPLPRELLNSAYATWGFAVVAVGMQGTVLARLYHRWYIVGFWFAANVLAVIAAVLPGQFGNQLDGFWSFVYDVLSDRGYDALATTVPVMYLLVCVSAVTGVVLVGMSVRNQQMPKQVPT